MKTSAYVEVPIINGNPVVTKLSNTKINYVKLTSLLGQLSCICQVWMNLTVNLERSPVIRLQYCNKGRQPICICMFCSLLKLLSVAVLLFWLLLHVCFLLLVLMFPFVLCILFGQVML